MQNILGIVVTAQLGNSTDARWSPNAEVLVIAPEMSFQKLMFIGLAKKPNGDIIILRDLRPNNESHLLGRGNYMCTAALNHTSGQYKRYMSMADQHRIEDAIQYHKDKLDMVQSYVEFYN